MSVRDGFLYARVLRAKKERNQFILFSLASLIIAALLLYADNFLLTFIAGSVVFFALTVIVAALEAHREMKDNLDQLHQGDSHD